MRIDPALVYPAILLALAGCVPDWNDNPALVTRPRVIAIESAPPEIAPGASVSFTAVVAAPEGPSAPDLEWGFCTTPRPLSENGPVSPDCVTAPPPSLSAAAPAIRLNVPADACRLFGPETAPRSGDRLPARPRDPDPTGGYYQPIRAAGVGPAAFGAIRILCNLASAPLEAALELRRRYQPNRNPSFTEISASVASDPVPFDALPADRAIDLTARWDGPTAEPYLAFDLETQTLRERRESLRVSWFITAGTIGHPQLGRAEDDPETAVSTTWRPSSELAPGEAVHLWVVLRDSRGGVSAQHRELHFRAPR